MDKRIVIAEQLRKALQLFVNTLTEEQAMELSTVYPKWKGGVVYKVGDIISYGVNKVGDPQLYKVIKGHTSQNDWIPGQNTDSLYDAFGIDSEGYPIWSQPIGAHDAYNKNDIVNFEGQLYISLIDGNVWSPTTYPQGWKLYTEY